MEKFQKDSSHISKLKSPNWILKPQSHGGVVMQFYFCPRQGQGSEHNPKKIKVAKVLSSKFSQSWNYILRRNIMIRENNTALEYEESAATGSVLHDCHRTRDVPAYLREGGWFCVRITHCINGQIHVSFQGKIPFHAKGKFTRITKRN